MAAYIQAIATDLPPFQTNQSQIGDFMVRQLQLNGEDEKKLRLLYRATGIGKRYSVLPDFSKNLNGQSFFKQGNFPTAKPRMDIFRKNAIELAEGAAKKVLHKLNYKVESITHLIAVSCTGMYAPGIDIDLVQNLGLNTSVQRTAINFMGCYAAFNALKTASHIANADPDANVLMVCVELCSLHLQDKTDDENLLSNAIFGDGAAAVVINGRKSTNCFEIKKFYSDLALQGKQEMGWLIGDHGFEMKLSAKVPDVIQEGIGELTEKLLAFVKLRLEDISLFAVHPGGRRILDVIEQELGISKEQNKYSRKVLREFGNMSSPTVLFVINEIWNDLSESDHNKNLLSFAFGPGLTLESALLKAHIHEY